MLPLYAKWFERVLLSEASAECLRAAGTHAEYTFSFYFNTANPSFPYCTFVPISTIPHTPAGV